MTDSFEDRLIKILKKDLRFTDEESRELIRSEVVNEALKLDKKLIEALLDDKDIKEKFFTEIKGCWVFEINKFVDFIQDKNFLSDSYTKFKNKIGLNIDGKFLNERKEVSLVWPFKDCVLEGGMTKEDQKRNEIFFNEILAQDEIDRLLDPKVLTNFKRVTAKGEEKVTDFKRDKDGTIRENLIIKGNNLLASISLLNQYQNKVKLVYLDPPYNTPGEANTFSYNNNFNHSSWLTFMKNRVEVAKDLISEDGILCLAIDDVEYAYLKVLCDEVLGRDNFLATVVVQIKREGRTDSGFFAASHDYALFYCKNKNKVKLNTLPISDENAEKWKEEDETGRFFWRDFMRTGGNSTPKDRPNQNYVIYYSKKEKKILGVGGYNEVKPTEKYVSNIVYIINSEGEFQELKKKDFLEKFENIVEIYPVAKNGERQVWRWSDREKVLWAVNTGEINLIDNKIKIKDRTREGSKPTTTWYDADFNATSHGTLLLKKIFNGKKVFSYPKSLFTMIDIIRITTNSKTEDIILDMFGGSATTAHSVNRVNLTDKGNRHTIIIEQMDYIDKATLPRIQKCLSKDDAFIYFELLKFNEEVVDKIESEKTTENLLKIWKGMVEHYFLNYDVDIKRFNDNQEEFKKLPLDKQKKLLVEMLNKNQLYVNLSEIDDVQFNVSKEEKGLNKKFYK